MEDSNPMICSICHGSMVPVELHQVPTENIRGFLSIAENRLEDNWYWCSECDSYEQSVTPIQPSPEIERLRQTLKCFSRAW